MNDLIKDVLIGVFVAGGLWATIKITIKQIQIDAQRNNELLLKNINGVGSAVRADRTADEFRDLTLMFTTLVETEDKKERRWKVDKYLNSFRRP